MGVVVVVMVVSTVLMAVPFSMAVVALMEEEGEHTQETELGVHLDSHCPLTSGPLPKQESNTFRVGSLFVLKLLHFATFILVGKMLVTNISIIVVIYSVGLKFDSQKKNQLKQQSKHVFSSSCSRLGLQ